MEIKVEQLIRKQVRIDDMQFDLSPGKGMTDTILIVRQLQKKHLSAGKPLYLAFVDLVDLKKSSVLLPPTALL